MKLKDFCCCCFFIDRKESLDIRSSGYYESTSDSEEEINEKSQILIMTSENFQQILKSNKYVLVQFNDRR